MVVESGIYVEILWWLHILAVQLEMLLNLNCLGRAPARGFLAGTESKDSFEVDKAAKLCTRFGCTPTLLGPSRVPSTGLAQYRIFCDLIPHLVLMNLSFLGYFTSENVK